MSKKKSEKNDNPDNNKQTVNPVIDDPAIANVKTMTLEELNKWIEGSQKIDGNVKSNNCSYEWRIYKHDGELYRLEFFFGVPEEILGDNGYVTGVYKPQKVIARDKIVVEYVEVP